LFVRTNSPFEPFQFGGHQEGGRRGGTENVALIAGFGAAAELAQRNLHSRAEHARELRDELEELIRQAIPEVLIYGTNTERLPNTSNMGFDGIDSDAMVNFLDSRGICVSSGSACMSGALGPSHVILAMTGSQEQARQVIRFSVGRQTTSVEVAATVEAVNAGWHLLRV